MGAEVEPVRKDANWATEAMASWLGHELELGARPAECEVVFQRTLPWFGGRTERCFLVRWEMADGRGFIGFAGPVTWSFLGVPMAELRGRRLETLMNVYYGWYAAFVAAQDRSAKRPNEKRLAEITAPSRMRRLYCEGAFGRGRWIPVNLEFREHAKIGRREYFVFQGDLVFHDESPLPKTAKLVGIDVDDDSGHKGDYRGEKGCLFCFRSDKKSEFSYFARNQPLIGRLPLYYWIGKDLGPFT